jgi:hypothetical protein
MNPAKHIVIILEKGGDELGGRVRAPGFLLTTVGNNTEEVTANLRELIADFLEHEGRDMAEWEGIKADDIEFSYEYDLTALFEIFDAIKINSIASLAGLNQSLLRQYATGKKRPSERQAKKIEDAIHQLGHRLMQVTVA